MKNITLPGHKFLLLAVAGILFVLLIFGAVLIENWRWSIVACLLSVLGICAGALFLKRVPAKVRYQLRRQQLTEPEELQRKQRSDREQERLQDLQNSWTEAVTTLRGSHLKKQGNPLYLLPWYLVMGESGSGKSTAIKSARLSSPFEANHSHGGSATDNCEWSFLDNGIVIDTAGRYSKPVDEEGDNREWQKFLSLLVKCRKREAINGLIVTVAADKLVNGSSPELENDGRQLRRRIDELMQVLGIKFPVYVLVTKCDLISGMSQFGKRLPEKSLDQPIGVVNEEMSENVVGFLERFTISVAERLRTFRMLLLHQLEATEAEAGLLLFPDDLRSLQQGLAAFIRAAFDKNRYQDTPLLRGIYLGSGRQEGTLSRSFTDKTGSASEKETISGTGRGLFLHDFFERVLPCDRGLVAPTTRNMQWNTLTRNLGLTSWMLICVALCALLSYSFLKNMATIRQASAEISKIPDLNGDSMTDLVTMDRFRKMVTDVEQNNLNWWIPRFGLNESGQFEMALKARYCRQFQDRFLTSFDRNLATVVNGLSGATPDDLYGRYVMHLSRRINLLKARQSGAGLDRLRSRPLPSYAQSQLQEVHDAQGAEKFGTMYLSYLAWRADGRELEREMQFQQSLLTRLLLVKGNLAWVVEFTNRQLPEAGIDLRSFWGGARTLPAEPVIAPAFTRKGKEYVTALVDEVSAASSDPGVQERTKATFESWYRGSCFAAWQKFAAAFPKGEERLSGAKEWQNTAQVMATDQGPYFGFMKRAVVELEPFGMVEAAPPWLVQLYRYQLVKASGPAAGIAASAAKEGKRVAGKLGNLVAKLKTSPTGPTGPGAGLNTMESQKAVKDYLDALAQIAPVAKSRTLAHQMALQVFNEDPGADKSPFYRAAEAAQRLNTLSDQGKTDETFSRLIFGPITFYGTFVRQETACSLQRQWEEKVLKEVQGITDPQTLQYLLSKEGPVWKFIGASADPFIGWNPRQGYYAKSALGGGLQFEPGFNSFLTTGAKTKIFVDTPPKQSYSVTFKGLPTDANNEARSKPQRTRLELQCATGSQLIDNLNYPVSKTFIWSPGSCSDVLFQIDIGDVILTKRYRGPNGFPDFLRDFPGGRHTFYPQQFPLEKQALEQMGVRYIRVNYQLFGNQAILTGQGSKSLPIKVPARITRCWD